MLTFFHNDIPVLSNVITRDPTPLRRDICGALNDKFVSELIYAALVRLI